MIKNFILISILCFFLVSCGKKGDPKYVEPEKSGKKTIILLKGQLGSGKTTFVKELLSYKYKFYDVNSPTFGIINTYNIKENLIFHYDLYRINSYCEPSYFKFYVLFYD